LEKDLESFVQASKKQEGQTNGLAKPNADFNNAGQLQKAGEDIFRRAIEEQIELCRFFGRRWEQYLNLPSDVSRCRSMRDLAQVQSTFLTKMAADYGIEGRRLLQAY
jgi:hypothetical protein